MTDDPTIATLLDAGVLAETDEGDTFTFDEGFLDSVEERTDRVAAGEWRDAFAANVTRGATHRDAFAAVADRTPELLGTYWALDDVLDEVSSDELLQLLVVVDRFRYPPAETGGTPEGFLAVRGDRLPALVAFVRHGVVYTWREDCDPCDVMAEQFAALDDDLMERAVCLSVYGPSWARELDDAFGVAGAPTTLFVANGRVDARLVGAYEADLVATELQTTARTVE
jgi:thiol-disulfide isomerase/thioredoxin